MKYPWLCAYLLSKTGASKDFKEEWQWERYLIRDKMFAAICTDKSGEPIVTLKLEPAFGFMMRQEYKAVVPGHYMNKEHWNSINLEADVPEDVLKNMIDRSYELILGGFSKKVRLEILGD